MCGRTVAGCVAAAARRPRRRAPPAARDPSQTKCGNVGSANRRRGYIYVCNTVPYFQCQKGFEDRLFLIRKQRNCLMITCSGRSGDFLREVTFGYYLPGMDGWHLYLCAPAQGNWNHVSLKATKSVIVKPCKSTAHASHCLHRKNVHTKRCTAGRLHLDFEKLGEEKGADLAISGLLSRSKQA